MRTFLLLTLAACLSGCASTTAYDDVSLALEDLPPRKQPAYIASSYQEGKITTAQRDELMKRSEEAAAAERAEAALLSTMTPGQQTRYRLDKLARSTEESEAASFANTSQDDVNRGFRPVSPLTGQAPQTFSNNPTGR